MKYIFINFINTLRHYKASSLLNIIGMAVAFAAFYIILTQVIWGFSYNKGFEDGDRIFLMVYGGSDGVQSNTCRPYAERTLCAVPEVESYCIAECNNDDEGQFHYIKEDGKIRKFTAYVQKFTQGALTLFKFEEEQGSFKDLAKPRTCAVSAKFAKENNLKIGDKFSNSPEESDCFYASNDCT
jgi:putative ABC transport system permease protein